MTDYTTDTTAIQAKLAAAKDKGTIVNIRYVDSKGVQTDRPCLVDEIKGVLAIIVTNGGYRSFKISNIKAIW